MMANKIRADIALAAAKIHNCKIYAIRSKQLGHLKAWAMWMNVIKQQHKFIRKLEGNQS